MTVAELIKALAEIRVEDWDLDVRVGGFGNTDSVLRAELGYNFVLLGTY